MLKIFKMRKGDKIIVYGIGDMKLDIQSSNIDLKPKQNFTIKKIKIEI